MTSDTSSFLCPTPLFYVVLGIVAFWAIGCTRSELPHVGDAGATDAGALGVDGGVVDAGVDPRCIEACRDRPNCRAIDGHRWDPDAKCFEAAFAACSVPSPQPTASPEWEDENGDCWAGFGGTWWPPEEWEPVDQTADCIGKSNICSDAGTSSD